MTNSLLIVLALCTLLTAQIVSTNEWPVAHNFSHTGFANTTVLKPPLKVKWMSKVSGLVSGESGNGAVVASGKVLIQGLQHVLVCLDAENGTLLWRKQLMQPEHGWHFFPCINGDKAYVVFSVKGNPAANGLYCLNLATGDSLWKQDAGNIGSFRQKDSPQYSKGKIFLHSIRDVNRTTLAQGQYKYRAEVQAWDALTGDSLWTYAMSDSLNATRINSNNYNQAYNTALSVSGDTIFASFGDDVSKTGKTVALNLNGQELWGSPDTVNHIDGYSGNIQYLGDKLFIMSAYGGANALTVLNPRNGSLLYKAGGNITGYSKISAVMGDKFWNRGYGATPGGFSIANGAGQVSCKVVAGDSYGSGCSAPRAANGYVIAGMGGPYGGVSAGHNNPSLYIWDDKGNPVWWFRTTHHVCQDVAIAYDRMFWLTNTTGEIYCFENDRRTAVSLKAICKPETLDQYLGSEKVSYAALTIKPSVAAIKAIVSYSDGSCDTTSMSTNFTSLDLFTAWVSASGNIIARNTGVARIKVERYGLVDTITIPIVATKAVLDSLKLSLSSKTMGTGESLAVQSTGFWHNAYGPIQAVVDTYATWTTEAASIVTVENGILRAHAAGGPVRIIASLKGKSDTVIVTVAPSPNFLKRINFQVNSTSPKAGWIADSGLAYTATRGFGWSTPADINVRRDDRAGTNILLATFILTARPTLYKIDVPDGEYVIRMGLGDRTWGSASYSWAVYGNDTLFHRINGMPNINIETKSIVVSGGAGLTLKLSGYICYMIVASAEKGANILCTLGDDDFTDPFCSSVAVTKAERSNEKLSFGVAPNPFNPQANLTVQLPEKSFVTLTVFQIDGTPLQTLYNGNCNQGRHVWMWNGCDAYGRKAATGIYLFRLNVNGKVLNGRAALIQ